MFRRADSPLWQFRYRIRNGAWHRQSTKRVSLRLAVAVACEAYGLARFRLRLGLAHTARSFALTAAVALDELKRHIEMPREVKQRQTVIGFAPALQDHGYQLVN